MGKIKTAWRLIKTTVAHSFELDVQDELTVEDLISAIREKRATTKKAREQIKRDMEMIAQNEIAYKDWLRKQQELEDAAERAEEEAKLAAQREHEERIQMYLDNQRQLRLMESKDNKQNNN